MATSDPEVFGPSGRDPVRLHRTVEGLDRGGVPIVLVHGVGSNSQAWDTVVSLLGEAHPVIRYDLRGHGQSPKPAGPYELEDFATDHIALMDELGIERAHVVGFSLGGLIAQSIALSYPERVDRLAILSAVAGRTEAERKAVRERLATVEASGAGGVAAQGPSRWYTERFQQRAPETVARHLARFASNEPVAYAAAYRVLATSDLADELPRIKATTLVLTGSDDIGSPPRMARLMAERIPDAQLVIVDGVKHGILEEQARRVAAELSAFLSPARNPGDAESGMAVRRAVLGNAYVDRATAREDPMSKEFQEFVTAYCWGQIWTEDDRLSRRERSLLVLAMTAALGRMGEFEAHAAGALRNGIDPDELTAVVKQIAVYCGVPAGVSAAGTLRKVLETTVGLDADTE